LLTQAGSILGTPAYMPPEQALGAVHEIDARSDVFGLGGILAAILTGSPRPAGWTGKLWALDRGIAAAGTPEFLWLTDADIGHAPDNLRRLVARATTDNRVMVTLMARLHCQSLAERLLIPAFVYFFAMLYPFARVNRPADPLAAAAGGCVLVRRETLAAAGGIAAIAHEIIDDCALARRIKPQGSLWLGLSDRAVSLRPYSFDDIRRMVARSAYAQLGYSPLRLAGTLAGLLLVYVAPPLLALSGVPGAWLGRAAWALMVMTMFPILRCYRVNPLLGLALPLIALAYAGFTLDSAIQHWRGRGGMWKGRAQAMGQA
jgi:hopene-associated glycosyltransferase HpnB